MVKMLPVHSLRQDLARVPYVQADRCTESKVEQALCRRFENVDLPIEKDSGGIALYLCLLQSQSCEVKPYARSSKEQKDYACVN